MTPYKVILLSSDEVEGYREEKPRDESMFYKRHSEGMNWGEYLLKQWQSSAETLEWASKEEMHKLFEYLNIFNKEIIPTDITNLVGVNLNCCSGLWKHCTNQCASEGKYRLYFRAPVVEDDTQRLYAENIIGAVTSNQSKTHEEIIYEILKHYKITRL